MSEEKAKRQYEKYCQLFARNEGKTVKEVKQYDTVRVYKEYCEKVFGARIPEE